LGNELVFVLDLIVSHLFLPKVWAAGRPPGIADYYRLP